MSRRTVLLLSALTLILSLSSTSVFATCAAGGIISSSTSYVYTPGFDFRVDGSSVSPSLAGSFHIIGAGDPALGLGIDNGSYPALEGPFPKAYAGFVYTFAGYPAYIMGNWAWDSRIDGCPDDATPSGDRCLAVVLSDQDSIGNGYFVFLTTAEFNQNYFVTQAGSAPINLAPIPNPVIASVEQISASETEVELEGLVLTDAGSYAFPLCEDIVVGYETYKFVLPRGSAPPVDRNPDSGWEEVQTSACGIGEPTTLTLSCYEEQDVYFAHKIVFESGFTTEHLGANSARVECGPNAAESIRQRIRPDEPLDFLLRCGKADQ